MTETSRAILLLILVCIFVETGAAQNSNAERGTPTPIDQAVPVWVRRGTAGAGHIALSPLAGSWHVELSIYGTMGRSPDLPPLVSNEIRANRLWIADGQYLEDTTEGTVDGKPYWRRAGWDTAMLTAAMNG
jgi:hypothetical protein